MSVEIFGNYQLIKKLAAGGMAQIYLARQQGPEGFEKLVVVKRILPHLAENEDFIRMFLDEARIAARLNHPNIVQIFNLGAQDDSYFIAMEYIHGEDIRKVWRRAEQQGKVMPVALVCRVVMEACGGLDYAHKKTDANGRALGIVHRDVSPQNIVITFEGGVKIVDFGIAKAADQATVTRSGVLKGKYSYMSPEQAAGKRVDRRSDIFALGVVLFEMLTGTRLFKRANDIQTLNAVSECKVPRPSTVNPRVPEDLDNIVVRALTKNPDQRYQEAAELQHALERWLNTHQLPSSSTHLASFMREVYADRLQKEQEAGRFLEELEGGTHRSKDDHDGRKNPLVPERRPTRRSLSEQVPRIDPPRRTASVAMLARAERPERLRPLPPQPLRPGGFDDDGALERPSERAPDGNAEATDRPASSLPKRMADRGGRRRVVVAFVAGVVIALGGAGGAVWFVSRTPASPPPVKAQGSPVVRVSSEPSGATVYLNDRASKDLTPAKLTAPGAGTYSLRVEKAGFRPYHAKLEVPASGELVVPTVVLEAEAAPAEPAPAASNSGTAGVADLIVRSVPPALLFVDGKAFGRTPATLRSERGRSMDLRLEHPNYQTLQRRVRVGEEAMLELHLSEKNVQARPPPQSASTPSRPGYGKVRFAADPWANVSCGSFNFGATPMPEQQMPVGSYECTFNHPEFGTRTRRIEVKSNAVENVSIRF